MKQKNHPALAWDTDQCLRQHLLLLYNSHKSLPLNPHILFKKLHILPKHAWCKVSAGYYPIHTHVILITITNSLQQLSTQYLLKNFKTENATSPICLIYYKSCLFPRLLLYMLGVCLVCKLMHSEISSRSLRLPLPLQNLSQVFQK